VDYFPFDIPSPERLCGAVIDSLLPDVSKWMIGRELKLIGVDDGALWRPFDTLSPGEQAKIMLSVLFLKEDHFLLIDEPTNHLDVEARRTVAQYLAGKKGFILVSHDRDFLDGVCDHIMAINRCDIDVQKGDFSTWWENKQNRDNLEAKRSERLKKDIKHLEEAARRTNDWAEKIEKSKKQPQKSGSFVDKGFVGHRAAKMMKRSKAIEERQSSAITEKSSLLRNVESAESLKLSHLTSRSGPLIELRNVSIRYDDRTICENISFSLENGDRIALCGANGSGKSSILKLICGEPLDYSGELTRQSGLKICPVSQSTAGLCGPLDDYINQSGADHTLFKTILRKLDFSRDQFDTPLQDLSGGQKKKILLAESLCQSAHIYVWDEPLNFIDIYSRIQLEELILTYGPTIIFVEHDAAFVRKTATKTIQL